MTQKQILFCKEYIKDWNASQAALRAGYSPKTATATGSENLRKPAIKKLIEKEKSKAGKRVDVSVDQILDKLKEIAFDIKITPNKKHYTTDRKAQLKAIELLGKYKAIFVDKVNSSVNVGFDYGKLADEELARRERELGIEEGGDDKRVDEKPEDRSDDAPAGKADKVQPE